MLYCTTEILNIDGFHSERRTMIQRTRPTRVCMARKAAAEDSSVEISQGSESEEEEWLPEPKAPKRQKQAQPRQKQAQPRQKKPATRKPAKPRDPKPDATGKSRVPRAEEQETVAPAGGFGGSEESPWIWPNREPGTEAVKVKEERLSFAVPDKTCQDADEARSVCPSSSQQPMLVKKEEPEDDFTFEEPAPKRFKSSMAPQGAPVRRPADPAHGSGDNLQMNWNLLEMLVEKTKLQRWVCANLIQLFTEENTIPFIVRYRKELIDHMDADAVREVMVTVEELCAVSKKSQSLCQKLKKEGMLTAPLEEALKNCTTADELEYVYAPYKKGSKLSKARRAKELGLEPAALTLLQDPQTLNLQALVQAQVEGLSSLDEVATGIEQILADMIAKDKETLAYVRSLCDRNPVTLQSALSKTALKEKAEQKKAEKPKNIDKFHLYYDFTCSMQRLQHHQVLAINRGENLKILTVKVIIPDRVKSEFCRWCVNVRWRPKGYASEEKMKIVKDAVEDSYKRLILPLLRRSYRNSLTASAEKESVSMFVQNLRQRLLTCPVRGRVIMGVDPGFWHGCKLAILSPTSQILHTDVVYLHGARGTREADRLRDLMIKHNCQTVVIGNGKACRETEAFFADLIARKFFQPLDVCYCIASEAGASIYSVSPEAVKEMPDLDPNLRSAVSIGRRVQDPLAELVKIDPKHIGIGTYQHDVSQTSLKAALDFVVQECVSFVGVDINMCSETLMRHVAGLNAGRARSIVQWREKNGPFVNREQLKLVKGLGPKSFQQCAGFIRVNSENTQGLGSDASVEVQVKAPCGKGKARGKAQSASDSQPNPLDQTCIHPESYSTTLRFLALIKAQVQEVGRPEMKQRVEAELKNHGLETLARTLDTSPETLQLIMDGLTRPQGFDIRQDFEQADFKRGIISMDDLQAGMILTGRVENTTLFGAFVDIGVGNSGLIHKSSIMPNKLPEQRRERSLALGPGERVEVRVLNVDAQRGRIGLDLLRVLS